ncbi:beta-galactosidase [Microbacterium sp. P02]|uniref:beta-galactosidase n=1 Tax=Microbacterium sp. P02 TaxID=3366260 RepID=UPI003671F4A6
MIHSLTARPAPIAEDGIASLTGMGEPDGRPGAVSFTDRFVTRGGAPWFPVMGEYHFSRDDASRWETELLKMKAGGVTVVATYLIWIAHEERRGVFRWDGDRDVRRFLALADAHGLKVMMRLGPWVHGETRNGGFPDWVQALDIRHRTNDPAYQALVLAWYAAIAGQVGDFVRTETTPDAAIIGFQTDNELYDQPEHLAWLRTAAEGVGLTAPLWTATGWGGAQLPPDLMPIYAGYSDGFWAESDELWPAFGRTHFEFSSVRDDLTVGADVRGTAAVARTQDERFPWVTCELGGGMTVAYHRRPLVEPADVAALALVKLGSGSVWQGYYMYHGGTHFAGELSPTQESHATGYPNDMPMTDYDFYAPIGALGQLREHYHLLRQQHLFMERYARQLLESTTVIAPTVAGDPRFSFRGDETGGFLFVNNHQPAADPLPELPDVQFRMELAQSEVVLPSAPVTIQSGASFIWPVRRPLGGLRAVSATVQPITEVAASDGPLVLVSSTAGVPVEFVFEGVAVADVDGGRVVAADGDRILVAVDETPGVHCVLRVEDTTIVVLDPHTASRVWRGVVGGIDTVLLWEQGLVFDRGTLRLLTTDAGQLLRAFPPLRATGAGVERIDDRSGVLAVYTVDGPAPQTIDPVITVHLNGAVPAPTRRGGSADRFSAPADESFDRAATALITIPEAAFERADETALLSVEWTGDVGRASVDGRRTVDQYWYGREWDLALTPGDRQVRLTALPFDPASGVFVDPRVRPRATEPVLGIDRARITRVRSVDAAH